MNKTKVDLQDKSVFADMVLKPHQVNLSQGPKLCKIGAIYNNTLVMAVAKLFLHIKKRKMKGFFTFFFSIWVYLIRPI